MHTRKHRNKDKKGKHKKRKNTKKMGGAWNDDILIFLMGIKDFFTGPTAQSFYGVFKTIGMNILWLGGLLYEFISYLWKDISTKGLKSSVLQTILIIAGVISSFYVVGLGLTATGAVNVLGSGGIVSGWTTAISGFNIFNVIGTIFVLISNVLGTIGSSVWYLLFSGPTVITSMTYIILITGASSLIMCLLFQAIHASDIMQAFKKTSNPVEAYKIYIENSNKQDEKKAEEAEKKAREAEKKAQEESKKVLEDITKEVEELEARLIKAERIIFILNGIISLNDSQKESLKNNTTSKQTIDEELKNKRKEKKEIEQKILDYENAELERKEKSETQQKVKELKEKIIKIERSLRSAKDQKNANNTEKLKKSLNDANVELKSAIQLAELAASRVADREAYNELKIPNILNNSDKATIIKLYRSDVIKEIYDNLTENVKELEGRTLEPSIDTILQAIYRKTIVKQKMDELMKEWEVEKQTTDDVSKIQTESDRLKKGIKTPPTIDDVYKYDDNIPVLNQLDPNKMNILKKFIKKNMKENNEQNAQFEAYKINDENERQILVQVFNEYMTFKQAKNQGWFNYFYKPTNPTNFQTQPITGGNKAIPLSDKIQNLSTKKLLEVFNAISKEDMEKIREQNPIQFYIGTIVGFIKETETGYEFTQEGMRTLKKVLQHSISIIDNHCTKCPKTKSKKHNEPQKKHNKSVKSTEVLSYDDVVELKGLLSSLEFVHMASIHSVVRENTDDIKSGGGNRKKQFNPEKTVSYLKKEDVEWLKQKHPEKYEAAKKYGFVNDDNEMSNLCSKAIEASSKVNGIDIHKEYYKDIPPQ